MEQLSDEQRSLFESGGCLQDYEVLKPIGKGKFSVVYKAVRRIQRQNSSEHASSNGNDDNTQAPASPAQTVALKKINIFDLMDHRTREKTLKEVRLVQSIHHVNIVQYIDAFLDDKELYIAFEWAEAGDLKRQIRKANEKNVRFDEHTIWRYFTQLCAAILHMHRARIMHRDLKPANIFLTLQGVVKVGDLGLGRHLSEDTLEAHSKVGTPLYMSPEVLRGGGYDWKSDVWSLGCILYELAMLRSPFKAEGLNLVGLFQKINKGDYQPVPDIYSNHLRSLVTRMISLEPTNRPTVEQVWAACQTRPSTALLADRSGKKKETKPRRIATEALETTSKVRQDGQTKSVERGLNTDEKESHADAQRVAAQHEDRGEDNQNVSRPSSQQSNGDQPQSHSRPHSKEGNTRQRPSSREGVHDTSDDALKLRVAVAKMELIYERLKLLNGGSVAALADLKHPISPQYFATDSRSSEMATSHATVAVSSHDRFKEMCSVVRWLLGLVGAPIDKQEIKNQAPIVIAQKLLLAAERADVAATTIRPLSAPTLTTGCGFEVCVLLDALSEHALQVTCAKRGNPVYPKELEENIEGNDDLEIVCDDDHVNFAENRDEDSIAGVSCQTYQVDEEDHYSKWLIVRETPPRAISVNEEETRMIHARIDPLAWRNEVEKMSTALADRWRHVRQSRPSASVWRPRLEMLERHVETVRSNELAACLPLRRMYESFRIEREQIELMEKRVQTQFEPQMLAHGKLCGRYARGQELECSLQTSRNDAIAQLNHLEASVSSTKDALQVATTKLTDNSRLVRIKAQLKGLRAENAQLEVQSEMLRRAVWHAQTAAKQSRRTRSNQFTSP